MENRPPKWGNTIEGRTINPRVVGLDGADLRKANLCGLRLVIVPPYFL